MKFIKAQMHSIFSNCNFNYKELFVYNFYEMLDLVENYEKGRVNKINYEQSINDFIRKIIFNNSSGITGARPIILLYMMASIFREEFQKYFKKIYPNTLFDDIINSNFMPLSYILPMNKENVYNSISKTILNFKDRYKSPFVDNFFFIILNLSICPSCRNLFGLKETHVGQFLQLDVPNPQNNINQLINDYFNLKIYNKQSICQNCGCQNQRARKTVCLNLPNYLLLEFEDKNIVYFSNQIAVPLYNGTQYYYQYFASIYMRKTNSTIDFFAVIKSGNGYLLYSDDNIQQCAEAMVNSPCPSLALYKKISP